MLARLDDLPGVAESRVDWTGRRFLLTLEPGATAGAVGAKARGTLGAGAYVLGPEETVDAIAARRRGEAWMRSGETLRLSRYEARALAQRHREEAAREIGLGESAASRLSELFEVELNRAFDRTHAGADSDLQEEVATAAQRIVAASRSFLSAEQVAALERYLERFGAPPERRARPASASSRE